MTNRQPGAQPPRSASAPDHLISTLAMLGAVVAVTGFAPLTVPVMLVAGLAWYVAVGLARWLVLVGLAVTALAAVVDHGAVVDAWTRWEQVREFRNLAPVAHFLAGFGPVG